MSMGMNSDGQTDKWTSVDERARTDKTGQTDVDGPRTGTDRC